MQIEDEMASSSRILMKRSSEKFTCTSTVYSRGIIWHLRSTERLGGFFI